MAQRAVWTVPIVLPAFMKYLRDNLTPVPVSSRVPNPRPAKFVRCIVTNTNRRSIGHAEIVIVVECWAATEADADQLAAAAYAIAAAFDTPTAYVPEDARGTVYGPYASDDPDSGTPRRVFAVSMNVALTPTS